MLSIEFATTRSTQKLRHIVHYVRQPVGDQVERPSDKYAPKTDIFGEPTEGNQLSQDKTCWLACLRAAQKTLGVCDDVATGISALRNSRLISHTGRRATYF
jgi:hypothetical protein